MKIEKILALVKMAAEKIEDETERSTYKYALENNPELCETLPTTGAILAYLAHELEQDSRKAAARSTGRVSQLKAFENIVKMAKVEHENKKETHGTFLAKSGARALCDGFRAVRITNPAITMPENAPGKCGFDVDRVFPTDRTEADRVDLPSASELRALIKNARADFRLKTGKPGTKCQTVWKFTTRTGEKCYFSASFLLDMVEALPGAVAYTGAKRFDTLYFLSSDGDAVLLPISKIGNNVYVLNAASKANEKTA